MDFLRDKIITGDCLEVLGTLPPKLYGLTITSPPYFLQRDYTPGELDPREVGQEGDTVGYISKLMEIFRECVRVTTDEGSIVWNLGDKYLKSNLQLLPYQFALAVQQQMKKEVVLINQVTWVKSNPTPRTFDKRMSSATEPFFHFVKRGQNYKYDMSRIRERKGRAKVNPGSKCGQGYFAQIEQSNLTPEEKTNARADLEKKIQAVREGKIEGLRMKIRGTHSMAFGGKGGGRNDAILKKGYSIIETHGKEMAPDYFVCPVESIKGVKHPAIFPRKIVKQFILLTTDEGDMVLDPFIGSGTTGLVCVETGRHYTGVELYEHFSEQSRQRIASESPLIRRQNICTILDDTTQAIQAPPTEE
jgi:DNA modification methylase